MTPSTAERQPRTDYDKGYDDGLAQAKRLKSCTAAYFSGFVDGVLENARPAPLDAQAAAENTDGC